MKKIILTFAAVATAFAMNAATSSAAQIDVYNLNGKTEKIEESAFPMWHAQGWYSAPVMRVYNVDGKEMVAAISDFGVWHDQGWYSAPVMRVYNLDGKEMVAAISDFSVWHAQGWYSAPVMRVYNLDGKEMVAAINDFAIWQDQGWYSTPVTKVFSRNGDSMIVQKSDLSYWLNEGWFQSLSDALVKLYQDDGQMIEVYEYEADEYINAGWHTTKYVPDKTQIGKLEGSYQDEYSQRASMEIFYLYDNAFQVSVKWGNSASSTCYWNISTAYLSRDGKLVYNDCYSYVEEYDYGKGRMEITNDYYGGQGYFYDDGNCLKWNEINRGVESYTEKCRFVKIG